MIEIAWSAPHHKRSQQKDKDGTHKCGRLHDHSWLRSGAEIATLPRQPPNQITLPRAGRLSRLTFPKTSCAMPTKRSTAAIRQLQLDWANHKARRRLLLACHRRRRQPVGFSLVCFLSAVGSNQRLRRQRSFKATKAGCRHGEGESFDADLKGRCKAEFEEPKQSGGQPVPKRHSISKLIPQALQSEQPRRRKALISELPPGQRWKRRLPKACW